MIEAARQVCRYWRTALADAELGHGALKRAEVASFQQIGATALRTGWLEPAEVEALFKGEPSETRSRGVVLRPYVYWARTEHGQRRSHLPAVITPLAGPAVVSRDGRISPRPGVVTPRDLLEPLTGFTLGSVEMLDAFLTQHPAPVGEVDGETGISWEAYAAYCEELLNAVFPGLARDRRFKPMEFGYLEPAGAGKGGAGAILRLYDALTDDNPSSPLFEAVATTPLRPAEPCLPKGAAFAERLGHSSPYYPLAEAQRSALAHLLVAGHGEVLAVNGPPGTGKTTLLLSVVATLWAKAALAAGEPPVIIAASTNNQAVTNIIDAFGKDFAAGEGPFAGRWLLDVASFGSYFPAWSRQQAAEEEDYQTEAFFAEVESLDYLDRAQEAFLTAGAAAFPELAEPSVERLVEALHARLQGQARELATLEGGWRALCEAQATIRVMLGEAPTEAFAALHQRAGEAEADLHQAEALAGAWEAHLAGEPVLLALFGWLPPIAKQRLYRARSALRTVWPGALPDWKGVADVSLAITAKAQDARVRWSEVREQLDRVEAALRTEHVCLEHWREALRPLQIAPAEAASWTLEMCDPAADRLIRFPIFLTATHYWEGRWLLDVAAIADLADEKKRKRRDVLEARWRRRMKLTPCAVSTFYSLPNLLEGARRGDGRPVKDYLWDFADLLIVDEAGQAMPEVGGAAFALAKRALVIGDTAQIPPIWNVPGPVDDANLVDTGLLAAGDLQARANPVEEAGRAASSGSVMRMSQHASRYHQDQALARGLVLYEHRRCFDEIIGYSNALCYAGKLWPLRGSKAGASGFGADGLPALGYAHIDGRCEQTAGGSRRNRVEAQAIAAWLSEQKTALETAYPGAPIGRSVGVIAPFAGQVREIAGALREAGIVVGGADGVAVGTVHTFQGAQRPVMLFSPTYSKHADGGFIDRDKSLLNVAVSRAQNSFLVFGDMDLLSGAAGASPRALLGQFLFADEANRLPYQQPPRPDLVGEAGLEHLRDTPAHDAFLRDVLAHAQREVHIVTPWIARRVVEQSDLAAAITAAAGRGVAITVYTDAALNADRTSRARLGSDDYATAVRALQAAGAETVEVHKVHSKVVMADDQLYCVGSFNWLSAARDGAYARLEASMVYRSREAAGEIAIMKAHLRRRRGQGGQMLAAAQ